MFPSTSSNNGSSSTPNGISSIPCIVDAILEPAKGKRTFSGKDYVILVMGPTGAGKSRFIEQLAGNNKLNISKDQLESVTKNLTTYDFRRISVWTGPPDNDILHLDSQSETFCAHIIDTPGFSDPKISELQIISMIDKWMTDHNTNVIHTILYVCAINDTRLPASKRLMTEVLRKMSGVNTETKGSLYIVTTMWDQIADTEQSKQAAERRFVELRDKIWKDLPDAYGGRPIARFLNTRESALQIVGSTMTWTAEIKPRATLFDAYDRIHTGPLRDAEFTPKLRQNIQERILEARASIQNTNLQLTHQDVRCNRELYRLYKRDIRDAKHRLKEFEKLYVKFSECDTSDHSMATFLPMLSKAIGVVEKKLRCRK